MDLDEFYENSRKMVDYIGDYIDSISQRRIAPNVSPGYLKLALPSTPPKKGISLDEILEEVEKYILPGLAHWQHPGFHGFLPSCSSYPATLGNMLSETLGHTGFFWDISPAGSELEVITVNWYGRLIGLPRCFLQRGSESRGSGVLLRSTNECIFIAMLTARRKMLRKLLSRNPSLSPATLLPSLVVYCSIDAHCSVQKNVLISLVNIRILDTEADHRLRGKTVDRAIKEDKEIGLIPFFVYITVGTTSCGACDPVNEIGTVCRKHGVWLHVDATYAGNAMICPEFRHCLKGIEYASSLNSNPASWMLIHVDCAVMFMKDRFEMKEAVIVDRTRFGYSFSEKDWGYPSMTEFRALEFWFVMRSYGIEGMREHIRNHVRLAKMFEDYVRSDDRFESITCNFGIVCFRLKGSDEMNKMLRAKINSTGELFVTPCRLSKKYVIRFVVCTERANKDDIKHAWKIICEQAERVLKEDTDELEDHQDPGELEDHPSEIFEEYYRYCLP